MKFKVIKGTETHKKLTDLLAKMEDCEQKARDAVKTFGGKRHCGRMGALAGGISAIEFDENPDSTLWKPVGKSYQSLFAPKAKHKQGNMLIDALPFVKSDEFNEITNYKVQSFAHSGGLAFSSHMGISHNKKTGDIVLDAVDEAQYEPAIGIEEITVGEAKKLLEE